MSARAIAVLALGFSLLGGLAAANAAECTANPAGLGTSRVMTIDPATYARLGTIQYPDSLPLADKEVVLTFDDGPLPPYTNRVLETLASHCVEANYFIIGRMARAYPELLRRIHAEGHVIGTHSENHPLAFERMPLDAVQREIEQGFASTAAALGKDGTVAPFFRIPGLLRAPTVENYLRSRKTTTWSADIVGDDWRHISASEIVKRTLSRLDARGKGIILLHDIQPATALALPELLRELKKRGYRVVQVVPGAAAPLVAAKPPERAPVVAARPVATPIIATAPSAPRAEPVPPPATTSPAPPREVAVVPVAPPDDPTLPLASAAPAMPETEASASALAMDQEFSGIERTAPVRPAPTEAVRPLMPSMKPSHNMATSGKAPPPPVQTLPPRASLDIGGQSFGATPVRRAIVARTEPKPGGWPVSASSLTHDATR